MFSTCLFCRSSLGANESFETFPVGRRLAYDATKGRLWVVCPQCGRWNLTPLEERWEAIDEAERRMERARVRASSGEVTLARLPEGTELVRVGHPAQRELATWRYGDQFGRRRRRNLVTGGVIAAVGGAAAVGGLAVAGIGVLTGGAIGRAMERTIRRGPAWVPVARLRAPDGTILSLRPPHLAATTFGQTADGEMEVCIRIGNGYVPGMARKQVRFAGRDAERALGTLIPAANRLGGTREDIDLALARLASAPSPREMLARLARSRTNFTPLGGESMLDRVIGEVRDRTGLYAIPTGISLAMEMAAHEGRERAAMEGDLEELEAAWREAEEIARIADDLLLPEEVTNGLARLKRMAGQLSG